MAGTLIPATAESPMLIKAPGDTKGVDWFLHMADQQIPVAVKRHRKARRIILRIDPETDGVSVTLPSRAAASEAADFIRDRGSWIVERLAKLPGRTILRDGAEITILGQNYVIRHDGLGRGAPTITGDEIFVTGRPEHLSRRITDWLKERARQEISPRAHALAWRLDRRGGKISIRDTRSRWGSCATNGNLSFSWRLVMAPDWVLDYVVAHEAAHLVHHNHSREFWNVVSSLDVDVEASRRWLNTNGGRLHRVG
ncbi:MAG: SprT family zinc-dependent metalloprotease [Proteobacteria bacterium]|nr:SprT family zinc-dependent metalloprotease [Pseudomonadota bacterium]